MAGPVPDDWSVDPAAAGAREVVPGLWRLRLPMAWEDIDHANAYAVEGPDGVVLFDCGTAGHASNVEALDRAFAAAGLALEQVSLLVGTHAHSDHIGLAAAVIERSGCAFWMHGASAALYDGRRDPPGIATIRGRGARRSAVPEALWPAFEDTGEEAIAILVDVDPDRELVDGDVVPSGLGDWHAVAAPGHAPSQLCFWSPERRILIAGDAVCAAFAPWFDYGYTPDPYAEWQSALDRIERLGPATLMLPGHGRPIEDGASLIASHRIDFAAELDAVRRAVADGAGDVWSVVLASFGAPESPTAAVWRVGGTLAYLRHLCARGEVERSLVDGRWVFRPRGDRGPRVLKIQPTAR
jgi:glyoxylase-like metal-dependent hydrolase (beta-lactamase superfamily II)